VDFSEFLGSLVLSAVEGLLLCTVLILFQYQDKEVRKKSRLYEKSTIKDSVY
jgi:hypothetical protein